MTSSPPVASDLDFLRAVRDVLTRARALIPDRDHWIQGMMSQQRTVRDPSVEKPFTVTAYCASGAIALTDVDTRHGAVRAHATLRLAHEIDHSVPVPGRDRDELLPFSQAMGIVQRWNDDGWREHSEVLVMFDRAIARVNSDLDHLENVTRSQR